MTKPIPKPYAGATMEEAGKWLTVAGALWGELTIAGERWQNEKNIMAAGLDCKRY